MITPFRILVLLLAGFYWLEQFTHLNPNSIGWQFRFLTIWTLTANLIVAGQMLRLQLGHTTTRCQAFVSLVVIMNMAVVLQYWRLFFLDPANVISGANPLWWKEYYLHLLGPLLMWIDAFLILGVFSRLKPVFYAALALGVLYPAWIELVIHPLNSEPVGSVTSGLPYPFLNNMAFSGRMVFYVISTVANLVFILIGWSIAQAIKRLRE
jgi:hypothetical protein